VGKRDEERIDDKQTSTAMGHAEPRTLRGREENEAGEMTEIVGQAAWRGERQVPPCTRNALEAKVSIALKRRCHRTGVKIEAVTEDTCQEAVEAAIRTFSGTLNVQG
jgi:hypothetical protein